MERDRGPRASAVDLGFGALSTAQLRALMRDETWLERIVKLSRKVKPRLPGWKPRRREDRALRRGEREVGGWHPAFQRGLLLRAPAACVTPTPAAIPLHPNTKTAPAPLENNPSIQRGIDARRNCPWHPWGCATRPLLQQRQLWLPGGWESGTGGGLVPVQPGLCLVPETMPRPSAFSRELLAQMHKTQKRIAGPQAGRPSCPNCWICPWKIYPLLIPFC